MGMHNSEMINEYCALSPVLRPLLFSIKEWAKPLGLNTPSGGLGVSVSFSSYALALMTIAFLQVRPLMLYSLLVLIRRSPGAGASFRTCRTVCRRWSRRTVRHWCGHGSRIADGMCDLTGVRLHPRSPTPMCRRCYTTGSGAQSARIVRGLSDLSTGIGKHFHMTRKPRRSATEACSSVRRRFSRRCPRERCVYSLVCALIAG